MVIEPPLSQVPDQQLAQAVQNDASAFDVLYRRHVMAVYRYCLAKTGNQTEAEDLTAQIFLSALESLPKTRLRGPFAGWLFGIARRKCADFYRQSYAAEQLDWDVALSHEDSTAPDPTQAAQNALLNACIQSVIDSLNEQRREALMLRFWGGLSVKETAVAMKRTQAAVKMLVGRAIKQIRARCQDHV